MVRVHSTDTPKLRARPSTRIQRADAGAAQGLLAEAGARKRSVACAIMSRMRVRITTSMKGKIDGIDLTRFVVGQVYDMGPSLANYLMASGYTISVLGEKPPPVVPNDDTGTTRAPASEYAAAAHPPRVKPTS